MKLKSRIKNDINEIDIYEISKKYDLPYKISQIILSRISKEDVESYIFPNINSLFSPFLIPNIKLVIDRIKYAKANNKKVVVFGDYDVDGITATSLFFKFFKEEGIQTEYYIPSRVNGYGLSIKSLDEVIEKYSPDMIFTVDCGITSVKEVEYIKSKNIEIIITDHHTPQEELPNCLIVNPHIEKHLNFQDLCGVGVAYKIIEGYYDLKKEYYIKYLPIVMIGTIADVVPLIKDNRIMVQLGFSVIDMLPKGIKRLIEYLDTTLKDISSQTVAYKLAPALNSVGRIKNADIAVKLFISQDEEEIERLCIEIIETNKERQRITEEIFNKAEKEILSQKIPSAIVLKDSEWDAGVIGIVASKILDKYKRTTILFTQSNGVLKGSCRSIEGINIFDELKKVENQIVQFGGHEKAAGLTVELEKFSQFKKQICQNIAESMKNIEIVTYYDTEITTNEIDTRFAKKLSVLEPVGECNPSPIFLLKMVLPDIEFMKNDKHILLKYQNLKIKYFNADKQVNNYKSFTESQNLVKISTSVFNNHEFLNLICDSGNLFYKLIDKKDYSDQEDKRFLALSKNIEYKEPKICTLSDLENQDNFVICTYNKTNFKKLESYFKDKVTYSVNSVIMVEKRKNVCFCLENLKELSNFENVYFVEKNFCNFVKMENKGLICDGFQDFEGQNLTREKLGYCYMAIKNYQLERDEIDLNGIELYNYFKKIYTNFEIKKQEFLVALLIFEELNIIRYEDDKIILDLDQKCQLNDSKLLKFNF